MQIIQLWCSINWCRLCYNGCMCSNKLEDICKQEDGLLACCPHSSSLYGLFTSVHLLLFSRLLQKHSKKLFDMCNLGEEYYLGQKRNEVLRACNKILDVEDFWASKPWLQIKLWKCLNYQLIQLLIKLYNLSID